MACETTERFTAGGRACAALGTPAAEQIIIQPMSAEGMEKLGDEYELIRGLLDVPADRNFLLCAFEIKDWNSELSPWEAPPAFGDEPFGSGARDTLRFIEEELLPELGRMRPEAAEAPKLIIGGYSLAGLFALWAGLESRAFSGVMAASPSVWFPGFSDYAAGREMNAGRVYLSLGDREERTRNPLMRPVGDRIRALATDLSTQLGAENVLLEWNKGGHFADHELRCARGFAWTISL